MKQREYKVEYGDQSVADHKLPLHAIFYLRDEEAVVLSAIFGPWVKHRWRELKYLSLHARLEDLEDAVTWAPKAVIYRGKWYDEMADIEEKISKVDREMRSNRRWTSRLAKTREYVEEDGTIRGPADLSDKALIAWIWIELADGDENLIYPTYEQLSDAFKQARPRLKQSNFKDQVGQLQAAGMKLAEDVKRDIS